MRQSRPERAERDPRRLDSRRPDSRRLGAILRLATVQIPPARGLVPLVAVLAAWQVLAPGPSAYFPSPFEWWKAAMALRASGQLWPAFSVTAVTFAEGLAIAVAIGSVLGIAIGALRPVERALGPLLEFMRAIPPPVVVPVAALLLGYGLTMKLTVVVLSAIWPILLNTSSAAARVEPLLFDVARTFHLPAARRIGQIVVPSTVPSFLLGIRVAIPLAIVVTLLVEMLTAMPGVGALMIQAQRNFQSAQVYALLVMVGLFGFVVNDLFVIVEAILLRRWPRRAHELS
jgi:ABC-type nitrate/sulfonate/bicarbonate transport system permease component